MLKHCSEASRMTLKPRPVTTSDPERERWLTGIVRITEAAQLRGVSPDTLKRDAVARGQLLRLGPRAIGVRRRFALLID
jgi:hypothetical protein